MRALMMERVVDELLLILRDRPVHQVVRLEQRLVAAGGHIPDGDELARLHRLGRLARVILQARRILGRVHLRRRRHVRREHTPGAERPQHERGDQEQLHSAP
ncbi:hypothetical protein [Clavibacter nebraskensis]|uniref:hypothetical protein n=1 Tax=Clavibacter nebraskensis TaxID=31963 RepID=UPI003F8555F1